MNASSRRLTLHAAAFAALLSSLTQFACGNDEGSAGVDVGTRPVFTTLLVTCGANTLIAGQTTQCTAFPKDQFNNPYTGVTTMWQTNDSTLATVDTVGKVTGVRAGTVSLTVTGCAGGMTRSGTTTITITPPTFLTGYEVITAETAVDNGPFKQLQVACPPGKRVLGAGWAALDPSRPFVEGAVTYSQPTPHGTSWLVQAKSQSTSTWKLQVRVMCANTTGLPGYEVVQAETAVDSEAFKWLPMSCPNGKKAVGAGWGVLTGTGGILEGEEVADAPSWDGAGWLIGASNRSSFAPTWKLKGHLVCVTVGSDSTYEVVTRETSVDNARFKHLNTTCPPGKHALASGWAVHEERGLILHGNALFFQPSHDGQDWLTFGQFAQPNAIMSNKLSTLLICG